MRNPFPILSNRWIQAVYLLAVLIAATGAGAASAGGKKFIEVGWDMPDTAYLREHWQEMERAAPFDGLNFYVAARKPDGGRADSLKIWDGQRWERDSFTNCIVDLKACKFARFTDNFLRIDATPGSLEWQDDASWVRWDADATFTFAGARDDWAHAFGEVAVPDNAGKLVILLKAEHQFTETDTCWFDNVGLFRMGETK